MNSPPAVEIRDLHKSFARTLALDGVDLTIRSGEFFGLLGPNGAGKTTLINCIVGLVKPTRGEVRVFGHSVAREGLEAKRYIGFSPQEVNTDRFFNLRRTLEFQGGFHGMPRAEVKPRAEELLRQFGLITKARDPFYKLSGGMQKRLMVARALVHHPRLLILDEPTAGVDVELRHDLWSYLQGLNRDGKTILLTTHYIDEAEALCERVGIINHGRIIELGTPKELIAKYCDTQVEVDFEGQVQGDEFREMPEIRILGNTLLAKTASPGKTLEKILSILIARSGRRVIDINMKRGDLETVFLRLTGRHLQEVKREG